MHSYIVKEVSMMNGKLQPLYYRRKSNYDYTTSKMAITIALNYRVDNDIFLYMPTSLREGIILAE